MSFFQAVTGARVAGQNIVTSGLIFNIDASESASYPGSGTAWYDLAGSNDATLTNGPTYVSSPKSIDFDGVDDYADLGSITSSNALSLAGDTTYTIDVWWRGDLTSDIAARVIDKSNGGNFSNGWGVICTTSATPVQAVWWHGFNGNIYLSAAGLWDDDTWCLMTVTRDGTSVKIYNNAALVDSGTISSASVPTTTTNMRIGGAPTISGRDMAGSIGAIRVYNRVLTTTEISQNFNARRSRYGI